MLIQYILCSNIVGQDELFLLLSDYMGAGKKTVDFFRYIFRIFHVTARMISASNNSGLGSARPMSLRINESRQEQRGRVWIAAEQYDTSDKV